MMWRPDRTPAKHVPEEGIVSSWDSSLPIPSSPVDLDGHCTDADLGTWLPPLYARGWFTLPSHERRERTAQSVTLSAVFRFPTFEDAISFARDFFANAQSEHVTNVFLEIDFPMVRINVVSSTTKRRAESVFKLRQLRFAALVETAFADMFGGGEDARPAVHLPNGAHPASFADIDRLLSKEKQRR